MIEVINLNKSYGGKRVLSDFSAVFEEGNTCVMGDSGSGKTTLIRILLGLEKPDSGEIKGLENKKISAVFQDDLLIEELSALKNVTLVCGKGEEERVKTLLNNLGLEESLDRPVGFFSGGMKRRVAIARALIDPADVYIFDEAFKGLDENRKISVINIIKEHTKKAICIFVTHDQQDGQLLDAKLIKIQSDGNHGQSH